MTSATSTSSSAFLRSRADNSWRTSSGNLLQKAAYISSAALDAWASTSLLNAGFSRSLRMMRACISWKLDDGPASSSFSAAAGTASATAPGASARGASPAGAGTLSGGPGAAAGGPGGTFSSLARSARASRRRSPCRA